MFGVVSTAASAIAITADLKTVAAIGLFICLMQRVFAHKPEIRRLFEGRRLRVAMQSGLTFLFLIGIGKSIAAPFKPFLYFRF
jgi:hypothetical protein